MPESSRRLLEEGVTGENAQSGIEQSFHWQSAPIYALTIVVCALLLGDAVTRGVGTPEWLAWNSLFGFRLALLAAVLGGARILYQTLDGLLQGRVGADLALSIACLAAILLGEQTVAGLVVLIALVGESIEGYTVDRATHAIRKAYDLAPRLVHVWRNGIETDIPLLELKCGERVSVRAGERFPADGVLVEGATSVDQSALTGESLPIEVGVGDRVFAGTVNLFGLVQAEVIHVGQGTAVGRIAAVVQEALRNKAPLEREADRLSRYFLPIVLGIAGLTLVGWRLREGTWASGWLPALSVLVVACPCALVLATPSSVLAAMAWLARKGVVIKGSAVLEHLAQVDTIAFDKTGTLTTGQLSLAEIVTETSNIGVSSDRLLCLAACAARGSSHPLSRVIAEAADQRGLVLPLCDSTRESPGLGLSTRLVNDADTSSTTQLIVGNAKWLRQNQVDWNDGWERRLREHEGRGNTLVLVAQVVTSSSALSDEAVTSKLLGFLAVKDQPRVVASSVIRQLRSVGISWMALLTGDRQQAALDTAQQLEGLDETHADLLPADKANWIDQQQATGKRVAMIGDGINDALALQRAHVGIAVGKAGSDLAAEAGDVILLGDPLAVLPGLLALSRELVHTIRNGILYFAFGLNSIGVLASAWGWFNPIASALFHEAGSLAVMLYSLRLLWFKSEPENSQVAKSNEWSERLSQLLEWASPSAFVYGLIRHRSKLIPLSVALGLLTWFGSNLSLVASNERALVYRFGRFHETLDSGWYWRWPIPLEQVRKERVDELRPVQVGFRSKPLVIRRPGEFRSPVEWQTSHNDMGYQVLADESTLLTGDELLLELTAEGQYQISDLRLYVEGSAEPEQMVRAVLESAVRDVISQQALAPLLSNSRGDVESQCLSLARNRLQKHQLGLELVSLHLLDLHPPGEVVLAYRDVANALEEREQQLNLGQTLAARTLISAAGETASQQLNLEVSASRSHEITDDSASSPVAFERESVWALPEDVWTELTSERDGQLSIAGQASVKLNSAHSSRIRQRSEAKGRYERFRPLIAAYQGHPVLTTIHLYWQSLEQTLSNRSLVIIDPDAKGSRQLWLPDSNTPDLPRTVVKPIEPLPPTRSEESP